MKKEKITQSDAVLLLLKYKPKSTLDIIKGELPAYYRKDLGNVISEMADREIIEKSLETKEMVVCFKYSLTNRGRKTLYKRFAQLRHDDSTVNELEGLVYAFGM